MVAIKAARALLVIGASSKYYRTAPYILQTTDTVQIGLTPMMAPARSYVTAQVRMTVGRAY
jgi:hypothetical protein